MIYSPQKGRIEGAILKVTEKVKPPSKSWKALSEQELFDELVSCILGSRVSFEMAESAFHNLKRKRMLIVSTILSNPEKAEHNISSELNRSIYPSATRSDVKYIYSKSKANFIVRTCRQIYAQKKTSIKNVLTNSNDEKEVREILSEICVGIGFKQASLFLRNTSYAENLAILDSHVVSYIEYMGIHKKRDKKSITKKEYIEYENKLLSYAETLKKPLSKLDVAIWIVMRVAKRDFGWIL